MKGYPFFVLLITCCTIGSCSSDCYCTKELGCTILTVKKLNGPSANTVVLTKTFCSQVDYHADVALADSVAAFQKQYSTDSTYVELKDSIYKQYEPITVKRNLNRYRDSGYWCNCPR